MFYTCGYIRCVVITVRLQMFVHLRIRSSSRNSSGNAQRTCVFSQKQKDKVPHRPSNPSPSRARRRPGWSPAWPWPCHGRCASVVWRSSAVELRHCRPDSCHAWSLSQHSFVPDGSKLLITSTCRSARYTCRAEGLKLLTSQLRPDAVPASPPGSL